MRSYSTLFAVAAAGFACSCAGITSAAKELDRKVEPNRSAPQNLSKYEEHLSKSSEAELSMDGLTWDGLNTKGVRGAVQDREPRQSLPKNVPAELR